MTILDKIIDKTKIRVQKEKQQLSPIDLFNKVKKIEVDYDFRFENIKKNDMGFICEIKKASPSKGIICENFLYKEFAKQYEDALADALSILTEPDFFMGDIKYLEEIKAITNIPILRKDFIVDEYQIYQSKLIGADAILLICSSLDKHTLGRFIMLAKDLGLSVLVETHDEKEVYEALECEAKIIGVNNRNLKTFEVDLNTTEKLKKLIPDNKIIVSESGIKTREDILRLKNIGVNAVLIGETFMISNDKKQVMQNLRGN